MSEKETVKKSMRDRFLGYAEMIDAYRIVPRIFLLMYGVLVYNLYLWYTNIETTVVESCDAALIEVLVNHGESLMFAQELACRVTEIIGGPTSAQTTFVTTIIGLATPLFGFYANTGRVWPSSSKKNGNNAANNGE